MIVALIGLVLAVLALVGAVVYTRRQLVAAQARTAAADTAASNRNAADDEARRQADREAADIILSAKEEALRIKAEVDSELRERRAEVARQEQRAAQRDETLDRRRREIENGQAKLETREGELDSLRRTVEEERASVEAELQRVAALTQQEARGELLARVEAQLEGEVAERIRMADARVREEVDVRSRELLISALQRHASDQTGEASVTVLHLPSEELKGRIIGREGRNIRALEAATGVDIIIDDTPEAVVLSGFDPVRREVAKMTLERLFTDGRIHPARIEEMVAKARAEMQTKIREEGEQAVFEAGLPAVHPELARLLGTLRFRTSYGHNVLSHSREAAALAGAIAAEIGYDEQEAKEIALFHDIGKAVEHTVEGPHAVIGAEILQRLGRPAAVVDAVRAHHYDQEPNTIGAFLLMTVDAISASRLGARRENLAAHVKRLERIESIAESMDGVESAYAVQAGKEMRVMVRPETVSDDGARILARDIARRIHGEAGQTGPVKVVVMRETRSVEYAR